MEWNIKEIVEEHEKEWKKLVDMIEEMPIDNNQKARLFSGIKRLGVLKKRAIRARIIKTLQVNTFNSDNYKL